MINKLGYNRVAGKRTTPYRPLLSSGNVIKQLIDDEKKNPDFICSECGEPFLLDVINEQYYCPKHSPIPEHIEELGKELDSGMKLTGHEYFRMEHLRPRQLVTIIKLRDNRYNYLYNAWQDAARGNAKSEFFLKQLKEAEMKIAELKETIRELKGYSKFVKVKKEHHNNDILKREA